MFFRKKKAYLFQFADNFTGGLTEIIILAKNEAGATSLFLRDYYHRIDYCKIAPYKLREVKIHE